VPDVVFKSLRFIAALGAVLFATVALAACGGIPGDAVVQVNGNNVAKTTFEHWMQVASASTAVNAGEKPVVPVPPNYTTCISHLATNATKSGIKTPSNATLKAQCATQYKSLAHEVLGFLISSEWVLGEANHLGVKVSDEEAHKQFNKIKTTQFPTNAEFEKFVAKSGQTVSDLLLRVKLNMLSQKIQTKIVKEAGKVTEAEIEKFYTQNKGRYGTPEKRSVEVILTKTEAEALAAKKEIESGKSFSSVAKEKSTDPVSKANGGLLPEVVKGQEEKSLDSAIFTATVNTLGGPVKTPFGYYIYEVKTITPGSQQSLAQAKTTIKQQLISTREQAALAKFVKEFKKNWTAKTNCQPEYTVPDCSNYQAPKK
jgi:foldase protein PrsA